VKSAQVLAAVVIPPDIATRLSSGTVQGQLELIYNGNALVQSLVRSQLRSALAQANLGFSEQIQHAAAGAIDLLLRGGNLQELGAPAKLVGLSSIPGPLARLVRGLVSREALLAEKSSLAAGCGFVLAFAMLAGVGAFVALQWSRAGLWLVALACGSLAFGALGVAIGALAREVRAASLL